MRMRLEHTISSRAWGDIIVVMGFRKMEEGRRRELASAKARVRWRVPTRSPHSL